MRRSPPGCASAGEGAACGLRPPLPLDLESFLAMPRVIMSLADGTVSHAKRVFFARRAPQVLGSTGRKVNGRVRQLSQFVDPPHFGAESIAHIARYPVCG